MRPVSDATEEDGVHWGSRGGGTNTAVAVVVVVLLLLLRARVL